MTRCGPSEHHRFWDDRDPLPRGCANFFLAENKLLLLLLVPCIRLRVGIPRAAVVASPSGGG